MQRRGAPGLRRGRMRGCPFSFDLSALQKQRADDSLIEHQNLGGSKRRGGRDAGI